MDIYNVLINDEHVMSIVPRGNIKFLEYPEPATMKKPYIVIDMLDDPIPDTYADNQHLALDYLIQLDLYIPGTYLNPRKTRDELSYHILLLLRDKLGLSNTSNAKPEYDKDLNIFRSARRYEGVFYRQNLNQL